MLRYIGTGLDYLVYDLVKNLFKLILYLADVEIFSDTVIETFSERVYMILAVVMFFKVAISTIQYIVDPDKLSEKDSGVAGLIKNMAITIILLVVVPEVFKFARKAQTDIAGYIPAIIMGDDAGSPESNRDSVETKASNMSSTILRVFVKKDGEKISVEDYLDRVNEECDIKLTKPSTWMNPINCDWKRTGWLPWIIGLGMVVLLLSMAIDIAIRAIKLGILEILAPIPIVSYIDKGGKGAFESWLQQCKDVYLDLFIRLIIIYFIVFIIALLGKEFEEPVPTIFKNIPSNEPLMKGYVLIFLIIGLLLFAKEAPKYLCEVLGIKGTDKISPMFKRAGGLFGSALGTGRDATAGFVNKWKKLKSDPKYADEKGKWKAGRRLRALGQAASSGLRTGRASAWAGTRASLSGKGFRETMSASRRASDRAYDLYEARKDAGVSWKDYQKEVFKTRMGIRQNLEKVNAEIEAAQKASDTSKAALDWVHTNLGAKLSKLRFDPAYLGRITDSALNVEGGFKIGIDSAGNEIKVKLSDMAVDGKYSINTVMEQLKKCTTAEYQKEMKESLIKKGVSESDAEMQAAEMASEAAGTIDALQGAVDNYAVSVSEQDDTYKQRVGFKDNPKFLELIQEAKTTIIQNSSTEYGRNAKEKALGDPKIATDLEGNPLQGYLGDWLQLNKSFGLKTVRENKEERVSADSTRSAVAKQIADKYDKKS